MIILLSWSSLRTDNKYDISYDGILKKEIQRLELRNQDRISEVVKIYILPEHYLDILVLIKLESNGDSLAYFQGNYGLMQINQVHLNKAKKDSIYHLDFNLRLGYELYKKARDEDYANRFACYNRSYLKYHYQQKAYKLLEDQNE
ncbi:MAG TPA: hypothetical protein PLU55_04815, partial [Candidatus Pacearchaeota archaeon]|nr:hypothetical protein [Candidatus Pacearchaeota archaeon]